MRTLLPLLLVLAAPLAAAQHDHAGHDAPAGAHPSGLTADETAGLLAGRGLGMARPAELNRYPGPLHVLELADSLGLSDDQRTEAERLRVAMQAEAADLGRQLVGVERHLDALFASGEATDTAIDRMTAHAAALRGQIRAVHLRTHVAMRAALSADQIERYDHLRGRRHE